jgi:CPA2 family monovalent cation:H+ antiporter-2
MPPLAVGGDYGVLVELGALLIGLGMLARLADRVGIPTIPVYLVAGMALGELGEGPITFSSELIAVGADLGLVLLLFMLGLESSGEELRRNLARAAPAGAVDAIANFTPGLVAGLLLGWDLVPALLLGGATYISSSGVVAKLLDDLDRLANRETPAILSILVIEDLAMAAFLPLVSVLLVGTGIVDAAGLLVAALGAAGVALWVAMTRGHVLSRLLTVRSDEVLLLLTLGLVVLVAGAAEALQLSAPVGAFLVGIALSGPVAERARRILSPLRDLFAATFFVFFGLGIEVGTLSSVALPAVALALVTGATKLGTGMWAAARIGVGTRRTAARGHEPRGPRRVLGHRRRHRRGGGRRGRARPARRRLRPRDRPGRLGARARGWLSGCGKRSAANWR